VDQITLRHFICFSALRHPDVLRSGHRLIGRLTEVLSNVNGLTEDQFKQQIVRFGVNEIDATWAFHFLSTFHEDDLQAQVEDIQSRTGNDPDLPSQMAICSEAVERVFFMLIKHKITVLDCPAHLDFILGDTPFPATLYPGFVIPLGKKIALEWKPSNDSLDPWTRRTASDAEVQQINRTQADNAARLIIGPSAQVLNQY